MRQFDYSALKGKTIAEGKTDRDVATAAGMTPTTYSLKINNKSFFTQEQMLRICDFLGIPYCETPLYFFTQKVQLN